MAIGCKAIWDILYHKSKVIEDLRLTSSRVSEVNNLQSSSFTSRTENKWRVNTKCRRIDGTLWMESALPGKGAVRISIRSIASFDFSKSVTIRQKKKF